MAIRFDNATERITATANIPSYDADYTVMAWVYVVTHNGSGNGACVYSIDDQTNDVDEFYLDAPDGTNLRIAMVTLQNGSASGDTATATFTAGTWQHVCVVRAANNVRRGYRNGALEFTHTAQRDSRTAPTRLSMGSVLDDDLLNGRMAHIKIWTAALSTEEILQEMYVARPQRFANLNRWLPGFSHTDLNDYSGNGYNLSAVGTLATEDGPPVSWGASPWAVPFILPEGGQTYEESLTFGAAVASAFTNQLQAGSSLSLSTSAAMSDGNSLNGQSAALMSAQFSQAATTSVLIEKTLAELSTLMAQTVAGGIAVDSSLSLSAQLGLSQAATALVEAAVDSLAAILEQAQAGSGDLGAALALSAQLSVLAGGQLDVNSAFTLAAVLETIYTFGGSTDVALELAAVLALSGSGQIQVGGNLSLQCALQLAQMALGDLQANTNLDLALSVSNYGAQVVGAILQLGNLLDVQIGGGLSADVLLALAAQMAVTPTSTLTLLALLSTLSAQFGLTGTAALEAATSLPLPVLPSLSVQSAGILGAAVTVPFVVLLNFNGAQGNITYEAELQLGPLLSLSTVSSAILPSSFDLLVNLQIEQTAALQTVVELQIPLRLSLTGDSTLDAQTVVQLSLQLAQTAATQAILGSTTDLDAGLGLTVAGGQMLFAALAQSIRLGLLPTSTSFAMDAVTPACRRLVVAIETRLLQVEAELRNIVVPAENRTITVEEELRIAVVAPESRVMIAVC